MTEEKYQVRNVTPEAFDCGVGPCPAIYEVVDRTPEKFDCASVMCHVSWDLRRLTKSKVCYNWKP